MKKFTEKEQIDKLSKNTCGYLACDNFDKKECKYCQKCFYDLEQQLLASKQENKLAKQLILHTLDDFGLSNYDWQEDQNEITTELKAFIQENKNMRETIQEVLSDKYVAEVTDEGGGTIRTFFYNDSEVITRLRQALSQKEER